MLKELLLKQLNQELLTAAQMSYFAGVIKTPAIQEMLYKCAMDEMEHFSQVANLIDDLGFESDITPFQLNLEKDVVRALIILGAMEDTLIHYYDDLIATLEEPFKGIMKEQLDKEKEHKAMMEQILQEVKKEGVSKVK